MATTGPTQKAQLNDDLFPSQLDKSFWREVNEKPRKQQKGHGIGVREGFGPMGVIRRFNQAAASLMSKLLMRDSRVVNA